MGGFLLVLREKFMTRLFRSTGKEGDDGDGRGKGRAVKDLFKSVSDSIAEICIHQRQFPPDLTDRDLARSWNAQIRESRNKIRLALDAPNDIFGDSRGGSSPHAGIQQDFEFRDKSRVWYDHELFGWVGVKTLEQRFRFNGDLRSGRKMFGNVGIVQGKDPRPLFGNTEKPKFMEGRFASGIKSHPCGLVIGSSQFQFGFTGCLVILQAFLDNPSFRRHAEKQVLPFA
jgi:hypothetical protein